MRLVAVGHGIWIDEPGICRSRFDAVMCDTCVLSTPCVVCVGGSAIESMTRHPSTAGPECALRIATLVFIAAQMPAQSA